MSDKPCPFCGRTELVLYGGERVGCESCGAMGPNADSEEEAWEAWNRRVSPIDCEAATKEKDGKCLGYQVSDIDDEPIERCKSCKQHTSYEEES